MKIYSLDSIEKGGFTFKVSSNSYDGGVLVIASSDVFKYTAVKYFPNAKQAREWVDDLVSLTEGVCRELFRK